MAAPDAVQRLVRPGLRTRGVHAHGVVAVEADVQRQLARQLPHGAQLLGGEPLQVAVEIHLVGVRLGEAFHGVAVRLTILLGPVVPAGAGAVMAAQIAVDGIEQRVQAHRLAALAQERAAGRGARGVPREMLGAKSLERRLQHGHLEAGDGRIVHLASRRAPCASRARNPGSAMIACARREPCTSSTAVTSMNITFSACRLEARVRRVQVGSDGNSACTGLMPTKPAPAPAASRSTSARSVKSPMPQLCSERSV